VFPDPDQATETDLANRIAEAAREKEALKAYASYVPVRTDGTVLEVAANLGSLGEIDAALSAGAMGVGLFRTELLFMQHRSLPDEETQYRTYSRLVSAFAPHSVIIRTLDIGGDKPVAGIQFPHEENPFLGWRGIRMCLDRPDIFKTQLRALLRAAADGQVKVMLPMVSTLDEVERTRALIAECSKELRNEGKRFAEFPLGIMIETPAAVMMADHLAKHVAFFSIGTNDLTQYVMAADRMNQSLSALCNVENPAVMRAIEITAKAGTEAGIMVGMCGEAAARRDLIKTFVSMGITEFSMSPASIPAAKKALAELFGAC
jgi:phosphoenolpyruvate-protein phosphotransferase (PTS system enzyme I)